MKKKIQILSAIMYGFSLACLLCSYSGINPSHVVGWLLLGGSVILLLLSAFFDEDSFY